MASLAQTAQPGESDAAPAGASHRRTPAAQVTSVHGKLRHLAMADEDYGFTPGGPAAANARALQRAVNDAQVILLPNSVDATELGAAVTIPPYTQLVGSGAARSLIRAQGEQGFVYEAPNGNERLEGPKFAEFSMECAGTGIKLNDRAAGFSDDAGSQRFIMRPRFSRIKLTGPGLRVAGSIGIEMNKCFSAVIDQCEIIHFETGVKTLGCDFPGIVGRTRIWSCGTLIQCERSGTFGSGMLVDGADLLIPSVSFIKSSDHHLIVRNCYFEKPGGTALTGPVLDIDHSYITLISGNRFEVPAAANPAFLSVKGEGSLFVFDQNGHRGADWGAVRWNSDNSARYWFNQSIRQKIIVRDNFQKIEVPFNTTEGDAVRNERRDLWVLTPATLGFTGPYNYAERTRVMDGAFVLPAVARYGSLVQFKDVGRPVTGRINIYVLARTDVAGTTVRINALDGATGGIAVPLMLSESYQWHTAYEGVRHDNLAIDVFNDDIEHGGRAFVKMIVVERA